MEKPEGIINVAAEGRDAPKAILLRAMLSDAKKRQASHVRFALDQASEATFGRAAKAEVDLASDDLATSHR
ncbi:hypothetical protein [Aquabacter cavernae]|uniref:hypothetical protein n=1 Tax=Aquabacter cavernae TaxID=2496029 RepID=UPI000F8CD240|nr:hypothetical protein [Aquabacter cavernae]